jgi:hypothetical protein
MTAIRMPRGSILQVYGTDPSASGGSGTEKWNKVTEHNRSEFTISPTRIEKSTRMSNGSLRNFFIADKQIISLSWNMLPAFRTLTVDGAWGAEDIRQFYGANHGDSFDIRVNYANTGTNQESSGYSSYTVKITSFSAVLVKRGLQPFWNISITMEEV